jgi:hypothetical protein
MKTAIIITIILILLFFGVKQSNKQREIRKSEELSKEIYIVSLKDTIKLLRISNRKYIQTALNCNAKHK